MAFTYVRCAGQKWKKPSCLVRQSCRSFVRELFVRGKNSRTLDLVGSSGVCPASLTVCLRILTYVNARHFRERSRTAAGATRATDKDVVSCPRQVEVCFRARDGSNFVSRTTCSTLAAEEIGTASYTGFIKDVDFAIRWFGEYSLKDRASRSMRPGEKNVEEHHHD